MANATLSSCHWRDVGSKIVGKAGRGEVLVTEFTQWRRVPVSQQPDLPVPTDKCCSS